MGSSPTDPILPFPLGIWERERVLAQSVVERQPLVKGWLKVAGSSPVRPSKFFNGCFIARESSQLPPVIMTDHCKDDLTGSLPVHPHNPLVV